MQLEREKNTLLEDLWILRSQGMAKAEEETTSPLRKGRRGRKAEDDDALLRPRVLQDDDELQMGVGLIMTPCRALPGVKSKAGRIPFLPGEDVGIPAVVFPKVPMSSPMAFPVSLPVPSVPSPQGRPTSGIIDYKFGP